MLPALTRGAEATPAAAVASGGLEAATSTVKQVAFALAGEAVRTVHMHLSAEGILTRMT